MTTIYRGKQTIRQPTDVSGIGALIRDLEQCTSVLLKLTEKQSKRKHSAIAYQRAKERGIKIKTSVRPEGLQIERVK